MKLGKFHVVLTCRENFQSPLFFGSVLRGAFGSALRRISCSFPGRKCSACLLKTSCAYAVVFEGADVGCDRPVSSHLRPPQPYVLKPGNFGGQKVSVGQTVAFEITLIGPANHFLPHVICAVEEMARQGLGKKRTRMALDAVCCAGKKVYCYGGGLNEENIQTQTLALCEIPSTSSDTLQVFLSTPLRLKKDGEFQRELPFSLLVRGLLRRVSALLEYYGEGEPALDYKGLIARAESVADDQSRLSWRDLKRYSGRQHEEMFLGGLIGQVVYRGDIGFAIPLLNFCREVHLGKQASFGLGQIDYHLGEINA